MPNQDSAGPAVMEPPTREGAPKSQPPAAAKLPLKIYIDGELYDEADAKVSVFDHGLLYGDGVFEGIRFYNGRVFRLEQHTRRIFDSAKSILLNLPLTP